MPDDQFDGTNRHATVANVAQEWSNFANLTVAGIFRLSVSDPFGNPLSNIPIKFAYKAPPVQREAPEGWSWAYDCLHGHVRKHAAMLGPWCATSGWPDPRG